MEYIHRRTLIHSFLHCVVNWLVSVFSILHQPKKRKCEGWIYGTKRLLCLRSKTNNAHIKAGLTRLCVPVCDNDATSSKPASVGRAVVDDNTHTNNVVVLFVFTL